MKKRNKLVISLICLVVLSVCVIEVIAETQSDTGKYILKITSTPSNGQKVSLLDGSIYEVTSNYSKYITANYSTGKDIFAPKKIVISWDCSDEAEYYTVKIGSNRKLTDAQSFVTFNTQLELETLYSGYHYFYQIQAKCKEHTIKSKVFDFHTEALTRTISIEGVSNTRDIGGYVTEDGEHRIRQGLVYRGGRLSEITNKGREQALSTYRIKTDLDLRGEGETSSPLGDDVQFVSYKCPWYYGHSAGIEAEDYKPGLKNAIQMFANKDNYPIYAHCSLGRDRTGTICFLINALCGVGEKDLFMDYELSMMSYMGCYDGCEVNERVNTFWGLYNYINSYNGMEGSLAEKTEAYMLDLGITQSEIDSIRSILLEEVK